MYREHRLAWFYVTGEWPKKQIDHINGIKDDNRWCNLREANNSQNSANKELTKNNKSGLKGIFWVKECSKWRAMIKQNGKSIHLGYFDDKYEAYDVYCKKAKELFGEYSQV